jgi:hypothetical protein
MKHAIYEKALLLEREETGKLYAHKKFQIGHFFPA